MIARKLLHLEMFVRNLLANRGTLTEFGMLHLAETIASLIPIAEELEARPVPPRLRIIEGGRSEHEPENAA